MARILVADDHDLVRETIAAYLEAEGFSQVLLASDVMQALGLVAVSSHTLQKATLDKFAVQTWVSHDQSRESASIYSD